MENIEKMSRVQKLTFSAMVMALYIVILYFTQSFSFGAYQIRIALLTGSTKAKEKREIKRALACGDVKINRESVDWNHLT